MTVDSKWFKKSIEKLGKSTIKQDLSKLSSGQAELEVKIPTTGAEPIPSQNYLQLDRADSTSKFSRTGPTSTKNPPGPGWADFVVWEIREKTNSLLGVFF